MLKDPTKVSAFHESVGHDNLSEHTSSVSRLSSADHHLHSTRRLGVSRRKPSIPRALSGLR